MDIPGERVVSSGNDVVDLRNDHRDVQCRAAPARRWISGGLFHSILFHNDVGEPRLHFAQLRSLLCSEKPKALGTDSDDYRIRSKRDECARRHRSMRLRPMVLLWRRMEVFVSSNTRSECSSHADRPKWPGKMGRELRPPGWRGRLPPLGTAELALVFF